MFSLKKAQEAGIVDDKVLKRWAAVGLLCYEQTKVHFLKSLISKLDGTE